MAKSPGKIKKTRGNRFILFVGDDGAILVYMNGRKVLRRLFAPSPDPQHIRAFDDLFHSDTSAPIAMLVDVMDQSYVRQTLPPVTQFSVGKLIKRRLERDFPEDDIKGALVLGREKGGRKDWNYLLIALANSPLLQKWLDVAVERPNHFQGIYLVPVESEIYLTQLSKAIHTKQMPVDAQWQLLVSHNKVGGFRQVVLRNGKLNFTRMAQPIGESLPAVIAGNIEQEISNTIEYLKRLSYQEPDGLEIFVIVSKEIKESIDEKNLKAKKVHLLTPFEVAAILQLEQAAQPEDHYGDVVMTTQFGATSKHLLKLQTKYTKLLDQFHMGRLGLKVAAACAVLACLALSANEATEITPNLDQFSTLEKQVKDLQQTSNTDKDKLEVIRKENDIDRILDAVSLFDQFTDIRFTPFNFVTAVSESMIKDDALIQSFIWKTFDPIGKVEEKSKTFESTFSVVMLGNEKDSEEMGRKATDLLGHVKTAFKDYKIENSKLPGVIDESEKVTASLGGESQQAPAPNAAALPPGEQNSNNSFKITISGSNIVANTTPNANNGGPPRGIAGRGAMQ